jgi:hypothetical protein
MPVPIPDAGRTGLSDYMIICQSFILMPMPMLLLLLMLMLMLMLILILMLMLMLTLILILMLMLRERRGSRRGSGHVRRRSSDDLQLLQAKLEEQMQRCGLAC